MIYSGTLVWIGLMCKEYERKLEKKEFIMPVVVVVV
jgi:hypothetical protein